MSLMRCFARRCLLDADDRKVLVRVRDTCDCFLELLPNSLHYTQVYANRTSLIECWLTPSICRDQNEDLDLSTIIDEPLLMNSFNPIRQIVFKYLWLPYFGSFYRTYTKDFRLWPVIEIEKFKNANWIPNSLKALIWKIRWSSFETFESKKLQRWISKFEFWTFGLIKQARVLP